MLFNSVSYFIFLPIVVTLFFLLSFRYRWILLLGASYFFYMCWKPEYIGLIILSTLIDYTVALQLGKTEKPRKRKLLLCISIFTNLGLLFFFKYFNFVAESIRTLSDNLGSPVPIPHLNVLLPVGISFYTFQTLSYTIDVYLGRQKPEKRLGIFSLYVSFFPQLVAGPIERPENLLPQFHKKTEFDYDRITDGLKLIAWGLFKKVVIADRVAIGVNQIYNNPDAYHGHVIFYATVLFAVQIYCDFSGYSDIAIGSARIMGFKLMKNFDRPYFAGSISDFWKRWHISLSTWFRDYVYIPLGGNRVGKSRWYLNLLVTFMVSGLWHGANWTFVVWGALHGMYLICGILFGRVSGKVLRITRLDRFPLAHKVLRVVFIFTIVNFAWIFFRANNLTDAITLITNMFIGVDGSFVNLFDIGAARQAANQLGMLKSEVLLSGGLISLLAAIELCQSRWNLGEMLAKQHAVVRWTVYYAVVAAIIFLGAFNQSQQFIYFQF